MKFSKSVSNSVFRRQLPSLSTRQVVRRSPTLPGPSLQSLPSFPHLAKCFSTSSRCAVGDSATFRDVSDDGESHSDPAADTSTIKPTAQPIIELTEANFELVVMGSNLPVLIEAYSPNAGPQMAEFDQTLQKIVREEEGYLILARLNVMENMNLAQDLRIQTVPTLMAIVGGKAVNQSAGFLPPESLSKIRNAIMSIGFAQESGPLFEEGEKFLKEENIPEAAKKFSALLSTRRYHMEPIALAGLAQCALKEGNVDVAVDLIEQVKEKYPEALRHPRIKQAVSEVELAPKSSGPPSGNEEELLQKIAANPNDWESRYALGTYYQSKKRNEESMAQMFEIIKGDREWNNQAAKTFLIKMFEALGEDSELATKGRRRLMNLWHL